MHIPFTNFPDTARVWIYAATRPLTLEEQEYTSASLQNFVAEWRAHGTKLNADFTLLHRRFIVIAVDEDQQDATGCSIDACVHEVQHIGKALGIDFFNRMQVVYRDETNNMVVSCTIAELKEMIANHDFPDTTPVYDCSITSLGQLRHAWEKPANQTWLAKYFTHINA